MHGYLVRPCTRHCCYGSRHQWQGGAGAAGCGPHPNGLLRLAPSIRCRQHLSPGGHHSLALHLEPLVVACGLPPPRASYRPAPERVSSHAVSFGHMMAGPSGPTTMSTWPSVPPETVRASRSALETTSSRAWADAGGARTSPVWARTSTGQVICEGSAAFPSITRSPRTSLLAWTSSLTNWRYASPGNGTRSSSQRPTHRWRSRELESHK